MALDLNNLNDDKDDDNYKPHPGALDLEEEGREY